MSMTWRTFQEFWDTNSWARLQISVRKHIIWKYIMHFYLYLLKKSVLNLYWIHIICWYIFIWCVLGIIIINHSLCQFSLTMWTSFHVAPLLIPLLQMGHISFPNVSVAFGTALQVINVTLTRYSPKRKPWLARDDKDHDCMVQIALSKHALDPSQML